MRKCILTVMCKSDAVRLYENGPIGVHCCTDKQLCDAEDERHFEIRFRRHESAQRCTYICTFNYQKFDRAPATIYQKAENRFRHHSIRFGFPVLKTFLRKRKCDGRTRRWRTSLSELNHSLTRRRRIRINLSTRRKEKSKDSKA